MPRWEYFILALPLQGQLNKTTSDLLNEYGAGGWELVCVHVVRDDFEKYFFKRLAR